MPGVAADAPRNGCPACGVLISSSQPGGNREGATAVALVHPHVTAVAWFAAKPVAMAEAARAQKRGPYA